MYKVKFSAYCGMTTINDTYDEEQDARNAIADIIKERRSEYAVTTITTGEEWEVIEPDDCALVPDDCGTLRLIHITYSCRECGHRHETKEESFRCCTEEYNEEYA